MATSVTTTTNSSMINCADYNRGGGDAMTTRTTTIRIIRNMEGKAVIMQEATNKLQIQNV